MNGSRIKHSEGSRHRNDVLEKAKEDTRPKNSEPPSIKKNEINRGRKEVGNKC